MKKRMAIDSYETATCSALMGVYPPLDVSLLTQFLDESWRKGYTAQLQQINQ